MKSKILLTLLSFTLLMTSFTMQAQTDEFSTSIVSDNGYESMTIIAPEYEFAYGPDRSVVNNIIQPFDKGIHLVVLDNDEDPLNEWASLFTSYEIKHPHYLTISDGSYRDPEIQYSVNGYVLYRSPLYFDRHTLKKARKVFKEFVRKERLRLKV